VKRVLYGANQGKPVSALELPEALQQLAEEQKFDLQAYKFGAAAEQFRAPRIVKIGLIQNAVVEPTTAPFAEQRQVSKAAVWQPCMLYRHIMFTCTIKPGAWYASRAALTEAKSAALSYLAGVMGFMRQVHKF
jgi:hypothetical protein